jgi:hypothetical protein
MAHGFNTHFTDPKPGEMEMIAASGAKWIRMDFVWSSTEREPGVYDFSAYDRLMAALDRHGLRALFILDYANRHYDGGLAPATDAGRAAFARWAAAAATHFKGRGILWEMWNEPNLDHFWKPRANVTNYIALARAVGQALREAAPGELYIGPATSGLDFPFLEACFRGGLLEDWDAVSVHPYRQSGPETVVAEYGRLRDLIAQHAPGGKAIPILSGEWGFSTAWDGIDDDQQGALLARQWLVNAACGIPLAIWYDWHDDGTDPKEAEHHFGAVFHAYHEGREPVYDPKPAYRAATALSRSLDGFRFVRRLSQPREGGASSPEDWILLFRRGTEHRLAAWTTGAAASRVRLGDLALPLSRDPAYRPLPGALADSLLAADFPCDWSDARIASLALTPGADGALRTVVAKAFGPPLHGRVVASADGVETGAGGLALPAGATQTAMTIRVAAPAGAAISLHVERNDGRIIHQMRPRRFAALDAFADGASGFALHANTDGRAAVSSTQSLATAESPGVLPAGAAPSLRFTAAAEAGFKYFAIVHREAAQAAIEGQPVALGLWVHADGDPASVSCRLQDSSGEVFQPSHARLESGWQHIELRFAGPGVGHWGGNNDGVIDWPARWQALFLVDRDHQRPYRGELHFARPVLIHEP